MKKKICNEYFFSVEGETEKWYFNHLQNLINSNEKLSKKVNFKIKKNKSISSFAKGINAIYETKAFHICDYESNDKIHIEQFNTVLEELINVKKIKSKIDYKLGYSNFAFDLWIILHKTQQIGSISHRRQYVEGINNAFKEKFEFIDDYKEEKNFKRILSTITLDDVIKAVNNGNVIRKRNDEFNKDKCKLFGNFKYYTENPDVTINECVEQILKECGAI